MPEARREVIDQIVMNRRLLDNAGLYLNRYMRNYAETNPKTPQAMKAQVKHFRDVADAPVPKGYDLAFNRWKDTLARLEGTVTQGIFRANGSLVVGLGAESVLENAITVNRNWGVPYIPGSALKGLASHFMQQMLAKGDPDFRPAVASADAKPGERPPLNRYGILFGTVDEAAYVSWLDAWFVPGTPGVKPYVFDVLTPHHPGYSRSRGERSGNPPWDFDDPVPVPFLVAQGSFHVALQAPDAAIGDFAFEVLAQALKEAGIGAKTAAGYGKGTLDRLEPSIQETATGEKAHGGAGGIDAFLVEIETAKGDDLRSVHANAWCTRWAEIDDAGDRQRVAGAIYARWLQKPSVLKWVRGKDYARELLRMAGDPVVKS